MKSVLFLSVANSARSQMAEGLARKVFGERLRVQSAGFRLAALSPHAVRAVREFGLDISGARSKSFAEIAPGSFDMIVYLCAEEACPVPDEVTPRVLWQVADPTATLGSEEHIHHAFCETRDRIYMKLMNLDKELRKAAPQ